MAVNHIGETIRDDYAGQPQILLVEDESSVAQGLQMILRQEGYGVDLAVTGKNALDSMSHKGFDLLVADLRLPDMDGMEVIKRVKDDCPATEVIVITGYATIPSAVEAMKTGVCGYLPKPFTDDEFKAAVEEILKEKMEVSPKKIKSVAVECEKLIHKREVIQVLGSAAGSQRSTIKTGDRFTEPDNDDALFAMLDQAEAWMDPDREPAGNFDFQKKLVDNAVDGIMGCDKEGTIVTFNKSLEKMLGYSRDEVVGKMSIDQFFLVGATDQFKEALYCERYGGKNRLFLFETDLVNKTRDKVSVQLSATVLFDEGAEIGMVGFFKEMREVRKLEQEFADQARLLHQDKMMSLGRLAASVVHEINNPLAGVLNYVRLMIRVLGRVSSLTPEKIQKFQSYLTLVESETHRCSKIVSNLLAFSRKSKLEFGDVNTCELMEKCIMLSRHKLELQNVQIKSNLSSEIPGVWGDFNQIQQCIINLIFNAIDAMPEGGTLTIENSLGSDKDVVEIKIKDTGYGISEENISNIFDPFFSTKAEGEGLGLGLSTVHGIIDRHGGTIGVESELGKGTVFTIKLPKFHD